MRSRILFKVEKNRVLVPVGEPCPFACRYCYTRGGEVGLTRVPMDDILTRFRQFARENSFETIQFGYDGDPFARPDRGIAMLTQLATMRKHINFSTKAFISGTTINALNDIHRSMRATGKTLSALVSLSCWESASSVEPHTPTPVERIQTTANLTRIGIPVFIALRPILPHIPDEEYERIADEGLRAGCSGFVLGPLYADARGQFVRFIPPAILAQVPHTTGSVSWSAHSPVWTRYEDVNRLYRLATMIQQKGGQTFFSSTDAMNVFHQKDNAA